MRLPSKRSTTNWSWPVRRTGTLVCSTTRTRTKSQKPKLCERSFHRPETAKGVRAHACSTLRLALLEPQDQRIWHATVRCAIDVVAAVCTQVPEASAQACSGDIHAST
eukprot:3449034-Pleurochrysis_carterae.AAC.6